jgi:hypothetical protein
MCRRSSTDRIILGIMCVENCSRHGWFNRSYRLINCGHRQGMTVFPLTTPRQVHRLPVGQIKGLYVFGLPVTISSLFSVSAAASAASSPDRNRGGRPCSKASEEIAVAHCQFVPLLHCRSPFGTRLDLGARSGLEALSDRPRGFAVRVLVQATK